MSDKLKLWFFRDLNDEQRLKLFGLFGLPVDEIGPNHGRQSIALRHITQELVEMVRDEANPAPQSNVLVTGDLVERLRAKKTHMSHGRDMVEQQWPASALEVEAAEAIERLEGVALSQAKGMLRQLEACEAYRARAETAEAKLHASSPAPQEHLRGSQETIAKLLWERFSPYHDVEWPPSYAAEYRLAAEDILNLLDRDAARQNAAELLRSNWSSFCDADAFPGSDKFADAMEKAGFIELVPVTKEALEDSFAAERGIEPGGMMYRLTDAGLAAFSAASEGSQNV